jgi:hypothetical protein
LHISRITTKKAATVMKQIFIGKGSDDSGEEEGRFTAPPAIRSLFVGSSGVDGRRIIGLSWFFQGFGHGETWFGFSNG